MRSETTAELVARLLEIQRGCTLGETCSYEEAVAFADVMSGRASHERRLAEEFQEQSEAMRLQAGRTQKLADALTEMARRLLQE